MQVYTIVTKSLKIILNPHKFIYALLINLSISLRSILHFNAETYIFTFYPKFLRLNPNIYASSYTLTFKPKFLRFILQFSINPSFYANFPHLNLHICI